MSFWKKANVDWRTVSLILTHFSDGNLQQLILFKLSPLFWVRQNEKNRAIKYESIKMTNIQWKKQLKQQRKKMKARKRERRKHRITIKIHEWMNWQNNKKVFSIIFEMKFNKNLNKVIFFVFINIFQIRFLFQVFFIRLKLICFY